MPASIYVDDFISTTGSDTEAIQAALDAGKPSQAVAGTWALVHPTRIVFGRRTYELTEPVYAYSGQFLEGQGSGTKIAAASTFPTGEALFRPMGIAANSYFQKTRVSGFHFYAPANSGVWAFSGSSVEVMTNCQFEHLLIETPYGLDLSPYAQCVDVSHLMFVGSTEQMIHARASVCRFHDINKEAGTGTNSDPYIFVEGLLDSVKSGALHFSNIVIEGATSPNKTQFYIKDVESVVFDNLHFETPYSDGYHMRLERITDFQFRGHLGVFDGTNAIKISDHSWGGIQTNNAVVEGGWREGGFVIDDTSYVSFDRLRTTQMLNARLLDDEHRHSLPVVYDHSLSHTGVSRVSRARNSAGDENLLANPSFEAGVYGWQTWDGAPWNHQLLPSEVGPGLMMDVTLPASVWGIGQPVTVPSAWVGRNMVLTYLAELVDGNFMSAIVSGVGINMASGETARLTSGHGWGLASVNFRPQEAGSCWVGCFMAGTANVTRLKTDKWRLAFGPEGQPGGGVFQQIELGKNSLVFGAGAPTTGTWKRGDIVFNNAPSASAPAAWTCTTAGSPGTWKAWANLAA